MAGSFKSYFLRGLAVLLPTTVTIGIFVWGYTFIQQNISVHINRGLVWLIMYFHKQQWADEVARKKWTDIFVDGWGSITGFLVALVVVCILGAILASVVGKTLWRMIEQFIMNTPFLRRVYPYVKQVTDFFLTEEEQMSHFRRVVAVEYPRKGIWSVGFVTGSGLERVAAAVKREFVTVLIPTSPTPLTGFVITVQRRQTIDLEMTIEEALRFIVSGGVITPGKAKAKFTEPKPESENQGQ